MNMYWSGFACGWYLLGLGLLIHEQYRMWQKGYDFTIEDALLMMWMPILMPVVLARFINLYCDKIRSITIIKGKDQRKCQ